MVHKLGSLRHLDPNSDGRPAQLRIRCHPAEVEGDLGFDGKVLWLMPDEPVPTPTGPIIEMEPIEFRTLQDAEVKEVLKRPLRVIEARADVAEPFRSAVPTRMVSNGEYMPIPQTEEQHRVEVRVRELADSAARPPRAAPTSTPRRRPGSSFSTKCISTRPRFLI
ncbi:hypothetical protein HC776_03110 [bacterium]|nr:hypothetical protein [bacterium]